jgi:hypothetical protein
MGDSHSQTPNDFSLVAVEKEKTDLSSAHEAKQSALLTAQKEHEKDHSALAVAQQEHAEDHVKVSASC